MSLSLDHVLSLRYLRIMARTYNSSGITMSPITAKEGPMDGIRGTIKNVVFRQVKSGRVVINSAEEVSVTANKFVQSIPTLFQNENDLLCEPDGIS